MKKFVAMALVGFVAATANAGNVSIVALSGPHAWQGGTPSPTNGAVTAYANVPALNADLPSTGGTSGITVGISQTAQFGVVVELFAGTLPSTGNEVGIANLFFGVPAANHDAGAVDMAGIMGGTRDAGGDWNEIRFGNGSAMLAWVQGGQTPYGPAVEDSHIIISDDTGVAGGTGGVGADGSANLLAKWTIHGAGAEGQTARLLAAFELFVDSGSLEVGANTQWTQDTIGTATGGSDASPLHQNFPPQFWLRNGLAAKNAFIIEVVPEPATLSLLALGGLALLRRRVK
jgi:hypothetical protein